MKYGLSVDQYNELMQSVVLPLKAQGALVWLFGSRARGDHRPFSDIDIMVEIDEANVADLSATISEIKEKVSNSNFPYKVDLVLSQDFAESYRTSYMQDRIQL